MRADQAITGYTKTMVGAEDVQNKLDRLAETLSSEGYIADSDREANDYLLRLNHCPISAAAAACPGLCKSELAALQKILGNGVSVERTEHLLNGDRRCVYRIRPTHKKKDSNSRSSQKAKANEPKKTVGG